MEYARVAEAIRMLRSGAKSDPVESANGRPGRAAICGRVRAISRDVTCEASDAKIGMQFDFAFARIPRRGKAV